MTASVHTAELPAGALLQSCREAGAYADCYVCEVKGLVTHAAFVEAFYTTRLFKLERFILCWLARVRRATSTPGGWPRARRTAIQPGAWKGDQAASFCWRTSPAAPDHG